MRLFLARVVLFAAVAAVCSGATREEWRPARSLSVKPDVEPVLVRATELTGTSVELEYRLPEARVIDLPMPQAGRYVKRVKAGNAPTTADEALPRLPVIPARIAVPPGYEVGEIVVRPGRKVSIPGFHVLEHGERPHKLVSGAVPHDTQPDPKVYGTDQPFPGRLHDVVGVQWKRGSAILLVNLHPAEYLPKSGRLSCFETLSLEVAFKPIDNPPSSDVKRRADPVRPLELIVDNPAMAASPRVETSESTESRNLCDPIDSYRYVIVTSEEFKNGAADYTVWDLLAQKQSKGLSGIIVAMEDILADYTGVDDAEKLRNFIRDAYNNWETDYVLLGGDTNVVPMRKLWCTAAGDEDHLPSDLYFQCLDGDFNSDGDDRWGEPTDGPDGTDVDLLAEVYIGRASAETLEEMANFVYKTLHYENDDASAEYLRTALMCGEHLGFGGISDYAKPLMEEIRLGTSEHGYTTVGFASNEHFTVDTLYDADGEWPKSNLVEKINSGRYGIINHLGHANYNYVMKFYNGDAVSFTNTNPIFTYSQGCIPGDYERDCVGERLTTSTRHAMFAVVFNSRFGWGTRYSTDGPSQRYNRQFWDGYFGEEIVSLGGLNADSHEDNAWNINGSCMRWCYYESNLLGDPQTPMRGRFVDDIILVSPNSEFFSRGPEGGPFSPAQGKYELFNTSYSQSLEWAASVTSSWLSVSPPGGILAPGEYGEVVVSITAAAESLPEGAYSAEMTFTNVSDGSGLSRRIELLVNNPPRVTNTTVQWGDTVEVGRWTCSIAFNKILATTNVVGIPFTLEGVNRGAIEVDEWSYDPATSTLQLGFDHLQEDDYTLTLKSGPGFAEDELGTSLDGEAEVWPIPPNVSGNGIEGGDFVVRFSADTETNSIIRPFRRVQPFGSMTYDQELFAFIGEAEDVDRFEVELNAGQILSAVVCPSSGLQPQLRLCGPDAAEIAFATGSCAGATALIQSAVVATAGVYALEVGACDGLGRYDLRVVLNGVFEGRWQVDSPELVQDLDSSFVAIDDALLPVGVTMSRAVLLGHAERGEPTTVYLEDFEGATNSIVIDNAYSRGGGLWHVSSGRGSHAGHSPTSSVYYGQGEGPEGGGNYDTGAGNAGAIMTPSIPLPSESGDIAFQFNHLIQTEGSLEWDLACVEADAGEGYFTIADTDSRSLPFHSTGKWFRSEMDLTGQAGREVTFRFTFDTIDNVMNNYEGWYVDDISVVAYADGEEDLYTFGIDQGERVTLVLAAEAGTAVRMALYDGGGLLLATGDVDQVISYSSPVTERLSIGVRGRGCEYQLMTLKNAGVAQSSIDSIERAQRLSSSEDCILAFASAWPEALVHELEPNDDDGMTGCQDADLKLANDLTGSFVQTSSNVFEANVTGSISYGSDGDWDFFRVVAAPGDEMTIGLVGNTLSDPYLRLFDRDCNEIAYNDDSGDGSLNSLIVYSGFSYTGEYFIVADSYGAGMGSYWLDVVHETPRRRPEPKGDHYRVEMSAGYFYSFKASAAGGGPGEFANDVLPTLDLYDPDGALIASNIVAEPGMAASITGMALRTGDYVVRVRTMEDDGEYLLHSHCDAGPAMIDFEAGDSVGWETDGAVLLPIALSWPTNVPVSVGFAVSGTATAGVDFDALQDTVVFPPGVTQTNLAFHIHDNAASEGTKSLVVELVDPENARLGFVAAHRRLLIDDEWPLAIRFADAAFEVAETEDEAVVTVVREGGGLGVVTIDYATTAGGTALEGLDYSGVAGQMVFEEGVTSNSFTIPICWDTRQEGDETLFLVLTNAGGGALLGLPSQAVLTIVDYEIPLTNMLFNGDFETGTSGSITNDGWMAWGQIVRTNWSSRSGQAGCHVPGWSGSGESGIYQDVHAPTGAYTFVIWVRCESGYNPLLTHLKLEWRDGAGNEIQPATIADWTHAPSDGRWRQLYVTGSCTNDSLIDIRPVFVAYWTNRTTDPSALMFDDADLYGGPYQGARQLSNPGFEEGLISSSDQWRGTSWHALPESAARSREASAARSGDWGAAMPAVYSSQQVVIEQCLVPGAGTWTFAIWIRRPSSFNLTNTALCLEWYDSTFTNRVRPDSTIALDLPADDAWHEFFVEGSCLEESLHEVRVGVLLQSGGMVTPSNAVMLDDARFVSGRIDTDSNGLPDYWEGMHFGSSTGADPGVDSDGDGMSDLEEYLAGTDPQDSQSIFSIGTVCPDSSLPMLGFPSSSERLYDLYATTNLLEGSWLLLQSNIPGNVGTTYITDTNSADRSFYKVSGRPY